MSEVQRFWSHEASNIRCVREADFDRVTAERDALQALLTAADERADVLETDNKRLDLMVSQADYNYDADRMQFKARIDELEDLLSRWLSRHAMGSGTDSMVIAETIAAVGVPALKPAEAAKDEHVCTGCGSKLWMANCSECVPY